MKEIGKKCETEWNNSLRKQKERNRNSIQIYDVFPKQGKDVPKAAKTRVHHTRVLNILYYFTCRIADKK